MAVDFKTLLSKPAGEAKKPPTLPAETYPGVIKSYELGDNNKNKTPYVRFHTQLVGWPDSVDDQELRKAVDLTKRQLRKDYYLTDEALWRLDEFLRSMGLEPSGRTYEEVLPEAVNKPVNVEVQQYMNQQTNEVGNQIGNLTARE
jgi:hypothetical protein